MGSSFLDLLLFGGGNGWRLADFFYFFLFTFSLVGCSFLDLLLFFGGDGRRLADLLLGTQVILARMQGAGRLC